MESSDKELVIKVVEQAFHENPRLKTMARKGKLEKSVKGMTRFAYDLISKFDGVFVSSDKTTVMFYYQKSKYKMGLSDYLKYFWMFLTCIRISQFFPTMKRENKIESIRPDIDDYIYVWILGSVPGSRPIKGLAEINEHLYKLQKDLGLPILIETTIEKIIKLYKYVGFEIYDEWMDKDADLNIWFLKRKEIL